MPLMLHLPLLHCTSCSQPRLGLHVTDAMRRHAPPSGWYEALIRNSGWNFSAVYVGRNGMAQLVENLHSQQRDFLFSWCA